MKAKVLRAKDLLKTAEIIRSRPDETLSQALSKLSRSHDAVFVFNRNGKFLGVINPYFVIFKSKFPPGTKLRHCLFSPPRINLETAIWDIARLMVEAKVYFLPVFRKDGDFAGIVSAKRLFRAVKQNKWLANKLKLRMKKKLVFISAEANLSAAYNLMRNRQVSRLPLVDKHKRLVGIVTRFDLRGVFAQPKNRQQFLSREGDKHKYLDKPLAGYARKLVVSASSTATPRQILNTILEQDIGSVIIVNAKREPVGLVSSHDLLKAIDELRPDRRKVIDLRLGKDFIQQARLEKVLLRFVDKINRLNPIKRVGLIVKGVKNPSGKVKRYTVRAHLLLKNGLGLFAKTSGHNWKKAVSATLTKLRRQVRK